MNEASASSTPGNPIPDQLPQFENNSDNEALRASQETAEELRAAYEGWLERRGLLEDTTRLTMTRQEFGLLRDVGLGDGGDMTSFLIDKTKESYGIPADAQYVSVDIMPDDASLPHTTKLVAVHEEDFGTTIDEGPLESQGIELGDVPHITVKKREFELFRGVGLDGDTSSHVQYARDLCGIPQDDQYAPQYALIDITPEDPSLPSEPLLVDVSEADFGTMIDRELINKDFQSPDSADPNSPLPESGSGALKTVDIAETLDTSTRELQRFTTKLMEGKTTDPLSTHYGDIGIRAGEPAPGQKDAYVWTTSPFAESVQLTLNTPGLYDSVCVVRGQMREAGNGKARMAQIDDPEVVLKIEGENLKKLQRIYQDLYHEPDFALTEQQKRGRDELFNDYLAQQISSEARSNRDQEQARQDAEYRMRQPQLRAREIPRS